MDIPPQTGQSPVPQQFNQPQYSNPPPQSSGVSVGQLLIVLVVLLVGGGIIWMLSRSSDTEQLQATQTPQATTTPTQAPTNTASATKTATPKPTQTQTTTTVATFLGRWSGRFNGYAGCSAGNVFFDVFSNGTMEGIATTDAGVPFAGGGNVDANGNVSGGWVYYTARLNLKGKLLSNGTGSGTFTESGGCSGTFSVRR